MTRHELRIDVAAGRVEKRRVGPGGFGALATEAEALDRLAGLSCVPRRLAWDGERLVTALVPGLPLARFWTGAALPARQRLALRLVQAVEQIHARGVAHRDLTPQNVLVTPDGAPVLLDFELARMPGHAHEGGAIGVAAPELRWLPHPALFDRRVDLYALGILLRRLLGDILPTGLADPNERLAERLLHAETPEGELTRWVHALTAPRREDRPLDLQALGRVLQGSSEAPQAGGLAAVPEALAELLLGLPDAIAAPLRALVPLDGLSADVPEGAWAAWATTLGEAAQARATGEVWRASALELEVGHPWALFAPGAAGGPEAGPLADLLLRLDAPMAARRVLGPPEDSIGDPARLALRAGIEGRLGRTPESANAVAACLRALGETSENAAVIWRNLIVALRASGSLSDVTVLIPLLPPAHRGPAVRAATVATRDQLHAVESLKRHLDRRGDRAGRLGAIAAGSTARELALIVAELTLWAAEAKATNPWILDALQEAALHVHQSDPEGGRTGLILRVVAASLQEDDAAMNSLRPLLAAADPPVNPPRAEPVSWARRVLGAGVKLRVPGWAAEGEEGAPAEEASPEDERVPLALLHREGAEAALDELEARLTLAPRSARLWNVTLGVLITQTQATGACEAEVDPLLDALVAAGMPAPILLPWRMRARMLAGRHADALGSLAEAGRRHEAPWPALLLAAECLNKLGRRDQVPVALERAARAGAPMKAIAQLLGQKAPSPG